MPTLHLFNYYYFNGNKSSNTIHIIKEVILAANF